MWAHSRNIHGHRHALADHLRGTAALARHFGQSFGYGDLAWWTGLAHDGGKAWCAWQSKLDEAEVSGGRVGIDHKSYGVHLAGKFGLEPAQWAVAGHHGGLSCRADVFHLLGEDERAEQALLTGPWADADRALRSIVPELFTQVPALPGDFATGGDRMVRELAVRMLYSCLVDADALDTQAHRLGLQVPRVGANLDAPRLLERFLRRRQAFVEGRRRAGAASAMDELREMVFDAAMAAAGAGEPLVRMTAPTGAAKTIAAAGFALRHAAEFGKHRVIVAVPFITITEQNAAVYRRLLDDDRDASPAVLEHHSNVDLDRQPSTWTGNGGHDWRRLAAENWDASFVVTTTVQLLESLFGRKPSRMRKVHRLANSVIVLDEVQALPHRLLPPIADAIRILTRRFGTTVLLSSATQPELQALRPLQQLRPYEAVPDPPTVFRRARRVRYQWWTRPRPSLAEVVDRALTHRQVLLVVNTVRNARTAFEHARKTAGASVHVAHLSTGMCPLHRRSVLKQIRGWLADDAPVCLVSTSLIEAGVDLDFPVVFRAVAPPDSVAQAAGRCNREGRLGVDGGLVVVFDPTDGGVPPLYRQQIGKAQTFFGDGPGLADPEDVHALARYFQALYDTLGIESPGSPAKAIEQARRNLDFISVTDGPMINGRRDRDKAFRLIQDDTVPLVVPYGDATQREVVAQALTELTGPAPERDAWRRIQPYTTTLRRTTAGRPEVAALTTPIVGDLLRWDGRYDDGFGLVLQPEGEDYIL